MQPLLMWHRCISDWRANPSQDYSAIPHVSLRWPQNRANLIGRAQSQDPQIEPIQLFLATAATKRIYRKSLL
jgi:hypothetical protein